MSIRARLLLLILFATLIPALMGGMQFVERRDAEIAAARRDLAAAAERLAQVLRDTVPRDGAAPLRLVPGAGSRYAGPGGLLRLPG
ncbi:hypothetical protein LP416_03445 [Polaromonas sp. P2-4]|nr:hypothetical protein LP416_03445 [Polaromonas sp. P2-4]